jgi:DNA-binding NtrC family response regulator
VKLCRKLGHRCKKVSLQAVKPLFHYSWPGNVRELENIVERAVIGSRDGSLQFVVPRPNYATIESDTLDSVVRTHILQVLDRTGGRIKGPDGAAELLNMKPSTLRDRMRKLGISPSTD